MLIIFITINKPAKSPECLDRGMIMKLPRINEGAIQIEKHGVDRSVHGVAFLDNENETIMRIARRR